MTGKVNNPLHHYESPWQRFDPSKRLSEFRDFVEAGVAPATHDAWPLIVDNGLAVPDWLASPTKSLIAKNLRHGRVRYRSKMMKDYYRWRTVKRLRASGITGEVFVKAAEELKGTQYFVAPDTIESSFKAVEKGLKDPKSALQYYIAMKETREIMGTAFILKRG